MQLDTLQRHTPRKKSIAIGRGGKRGKTSGRGTKGQRAHGSHGMRPEMRDTIKKIPKLRGRGKNLNTSHQKVMRVVNIAKLDEIFATGALVSPKTLVENKLVNRDGGKLPTVKILATGETAKKFTVEGCIVSASARAKLEKGGSTIK